MSKEIHTVSKKAGDVLFKEGDPADCAYIIERGSVEVSVNREGQNVVLCELGEGEILGEMAVIDQSTRTATITVKQDCQLTVITLNQIRQRMTDADPVIRWLMRVLLKRFYSEINRNSGLPVEAQAALIRNPDKAGDGVQKIRLEAELIQALEKGDIRLVYQPIRNLQKDVISGFEALGRWEHPSRGTIPPKEFISLAEETDLIVPVGLHVLKVAVRDLLEFQSVSGKELFVSVNVSLKQIDDQEFLAQAHEICLNKNINPRHIKFELTESVLMDIEQLRNWVNIAKEIGFEIAVDDFGTGFASLEYLTRLRPDIVKIDRGLVRPLLEDDVTSIVLKRILQLAKDLDIKVIAEGSETVEHTRTLSDLGYDMAQGYDIGYPVGRKQILDQFQQPKYVSASG